MPISEWLNLLAALAGVFGVLTPYLTSYGRSKSYIGKTKKISELIAARTKLDSMLADIPDSHSYPTEDYLRRIISGINEELADFENKQRIGLFVTFCAIEVGLFFLLAFSKISNLLFVRIFGAVEEGGYGFWEGLLEPVIFRIVLILGLTIFSVTITLKVFHLIFYRVKHNYYISNAILILLFNAFAVLVFLSAWWGLVWLDRLTTWI